VSLRLLLLSQPTSAAATSNAPNRVHFTIDIIDLLTLSVLLIDEPETASGFKGRS